MVFQVLFVTFIGLAGGVAVGGGLVAFLNVLGVIPRLMQLTKTVQYVRFYEWAVIIGAVSFGWFSLADSTFHLAKLLLIVIGLFCGIFIGMLAAALTEVLNVFPILTKRLGIDDRTVVLLSAIVFGKIAGSLFQWLFFVS